VVDVDAIVAHIAGLPSGGARFAAFFALIGLVGMRPSEVAGLEVTDLTLPAGGWGTARLRGAIPSPGTRYTDSGGTRDTKALKHRPTGAVRSAPLPHDVVVMLRAQLERWPSVGGLVFTNANGRSVTAENYGKVWNRTKAELWPAGHQPGRHDAL
jgi:integrase